MNRSSVEALGLVLATLNLDDVYPAQRELLREVLEDAKRSQEAVAQEREACAMEAEYEAARWPYAPEIREPCEEIAKTIRARGETK